MSLIILFILSLFTDRQIFPINVYTTGLILASDSVEDNATSVSLTNYRPNITLGNNNNNNGKDELISDKSKNGIWAALPKNIDLLHFLQVNTNDKAVTQGTNLLQMVTDQSKPKFRRESSRQKFSFKRRSSQKYLFDNDHNNNINKNDPLYSKIRPRFPKAFNYANFTCPNECKCHHAEVECKNAQLESIPSNIPSYTEKLFIIGNNINTLDSGNLRGLIHLKTLVLSNNKIEHIEENAFSELTNLRRLKLNSNLLQTLPDNIFTSLKQLQRLDLQDNKLVCLPGSLFSGLNELRFILLARNNLIWLPGSLISDLKLLRYIDLKENPLQCDCHIQPFLNEFIVTNRLAILQKSGAVCSSMSTDRSLHGYPLSENVYQTLRCPLDSEMVQKPPQQCISLIRSSCDGICDCSIEGVANCQSRGLKSIPNDLPKDIMELNLDHNELTSLPLDAFINYQNLRKIVLDNNRISYIHPQAFNNLRELSSLYMSSNELGSLPSRLFSQLSNLKILYLHRNKISCIHRGSFAALEHLQILHLSNNRIQTFPRNSFEDLRRLKYLYLVHNPLICDCQLAAWLPAFLIEKEAGGTQWARCAEPLNVQGRHVRELLPHILDCPSNINYKEENNSCEFLDHQCPDGCRCKDIIIKPRMHANSEAIFRPDEFGSILGGLSVDCSGLELTEIPDNLPINTKELNLRNNLIKSITIESGLSKLKSLETLIIDGNEIEHIEPMSFQNNVNIKKLILSNNSLTYLEENTFKGLKNLEIMLLQHNLIKCLNNRTFHQTPVLKILMLNNNKLRCIAKGIFTELNLESLSLSANPFKCDCHLSWLPDWLRNNANQVNEGPSPPICVSPEDLAGTPVASLSRYHFVCKNSASNCLSSENLHLNEKSNTNENGIVQSVQNLYCDTMETSCCEVITAQTTCPLSCLCGTDGVYCSDRNLTEIPANISPETTQLYLERNQITKIDSNRIAHLKKLQTLVLSYNKLRELPPRVFEKLINLKTIVLSYNNLQCIHPEAFHGLSNLRVLILQGNNISSVPQGTFNDLGQLNNVALGQNPLHCDCTTKWLNSFFRQNFLDNGISLCHSPSNMRLKSIYHSKPTDFICPLKQQHDPQNDVNTSSLINGNENLLYFQNAKISLPKNQHNHQDQISNSESNQEIFGKEKESLLIAAKCMPCLLNPCQNGGTCLALTQLDYKCSCKPPYYGKKCEQRDHICSTNPCQNGGLCKITAYPSSYKCICPTGFHGPTCTRQMETCKQNVCENGGTCEVLDNDYRCHCTSLFHGKNCQHEYIYCEELNPCGNGGKCISLPKNNYRCECLAGWIGNDCQINEDDCVYNRCENGATCVDGINEYICKCRPGYAGIYCERPTWKQSTYVTRMDRPLNYQLVIGRTSVPGVRQSPIKTRSLTTQNLDTLCAYQQCQNNAKCVENQNDVYACICQKGFSGQFCENLFAISLPSPHSYVAVVPPSRGALVPSGTISFEMATRSTNGILLNFIDTSLINNSDGIPEHYLLVDLHDGRIHVKFSLNRNYTAHNVNCNVNINDGNFHQIKLYLEAEILFLYIDNNLCITMGKVSTKLNESISNHGHNNPMHSSSIFTYNMVIKSQHLALTSPLYFGGVPADQLEIARHLTNGISELGLTGCIRNVQINGRMIDFARLFGAPVDKMTVAEEHDTDSSSPEAKHHGTAIGILPGCRLNNEKSEYTESAAEFQINNNESEKLKSTNFNMNEELETRKIEPLKIGQLHYTKTNDNPTFCDPHGNNPCLNGGICENSEMNQTIMYQCKCPTGYKGERCEIVPVCHRETQRSYIRDPQTNCISSRKLSIRKCSGSCDSTIIKFQQQQQQQELFSSENDISNDYESLKYHKWKAVHKRSTNSGRVWLPQNLINKQSHMIKMKESNSPYLVHLNSYKTTPSMTKQHCCQATKIKLRPILFNCPNGAVYERTIKLAKKCTCVQCD
ncbi:unnamed protein product [Schistosoma bovis]|nr:unnamed protein product [Schistosoma bovis]